MISYQIKKTKEINDLRSPNRIDEKMFVKIAAMSAAGQNLPEYAILDKQKRVIAFCKDQQEAEKIREAMMFYQSIYCIVCDTPARYIGEKAGCDWFRCAQCGTEFNDIMRKAADRE